MTNELDKQIGTIEQPKLSAGSILVKEVKIEEIESKNKKGKFKMVSFYCKHPDKEELIKLSNMKIKKVQGNNETISKDGAWYREDKDSNIDKNCNASELMRFYHKTTLKQFENSTITTELDSNGYLTIKCY